MFDQIRQLSDARLCAVIALLGALAWLLFAAACIFIAAMWARIKRSSFYKNKQLKRENARLRKHISELRRECLSGKGK